MRSIQFVLQKYEKAILLIVYLLYIALVLFGVYHHEPWRDEAHAWAHAREASITELIDDIKYEGTPVLWYIILAPFAKSGFPYESMQVIHAGFAILAVGLFLFYGKIPVILRILFIFSYFMAYEYAVVARNYVLTILLAFLLANVYSKRFEKSLFYAFLIVLLFQTNIHSFGPAIVLVVTFCVQLLLGEKYSVKNLVAVGIMTGGALLTVMLYLPDRSIPYYTAPPANTAHETIWFIRNTIVPTFPQVTGDLFLSPEVSSAIIILTSNLFLSFLITIVRKPSFLFLTIGIFGWQWYVNAVVHGGTLRHHGLTLIYLMFLFWISSGTRKTELFFERFGKAVFQISLSILLVLSFYFTFYIYREDFFYRFSGAKEMVDYIRSNGLETMEIAVYDAGDGEAIAAYLPDRRIWYPELTALGHISVAGHRYSALRTKLDLDGAVAKVKEYFPKDKPALILFSTPLPHVELRNFTLLHESHSKYFWSNGTENYWLYSNH